MKTIKLITASLVFIILSSCATALVSPKPDKNPVDFSYEEQTKTINVKNLGGISTEEGNPYDDIRIRSDLGDYVKIKHDGWVTITFTNEYKGSDNDVKITVTENTSSESRSYTFLLIHMDNRTRMVINQAGRPE